MAVLTVEKDLTLGVAVLWFDEPGEKFNKLTLDMAPQFIAILDDLEKDTGVKALVLASQKPDSFIAGADIHRFLALQDTSSAIELSRQGNELFDYLARWPKPKVVAIHGVCMGGGTEMSLACDGRVASDSPTTYLALPEVKLGLLPGAGGTKRLPRLIGIQNALEMMVTGKNIYAKKAYKIGLIDILVPQAELIETAKNFALKLAQNPRRRKSKLTLFQKFLESSLCRFLIYRLAKKQVIQQTGRHYPAPFEIIETVKIGMSKGQELATQTECKKFGALAMNPITRRLIQLFFSMTAHKKNPLPDCIKPISQIAILGAGWMGTGIAQATANKHINVVLKDIKQEALDQAKQTIWEDLSNQVEKTIITTQQREQIIALITSRLDYIGFAQSQIVIEAVLEDIELKQKVLAETEKVIAPECIFASDTSCIPIQEISQNAIHPERVLGMHYFSPVSATPLLEIITTSKTADFALSTACELGIKQGKTMIVVNDGPGFYTTRILIPFLNEALVLLDEGFDIQEIDCAMKQFGFQAGPFVLLDEIGIDIVSSMYKIMSPFFQAKGNILSNTIQQIYASQYYGRKGKRGFYLYPKHGTDKGKKQNVNPAIYQFFGGPKRKTSQLETIQTRLVFAMMNEAVWCLQDNILKTVEDGDLGAILSMGFPPFLGGPFHYIDQLGVNKVISILQELEQKYGKKFTPAPMLIQMLKQNGCFYK